MRWLVISVLLVAVSLAVATEECGQYTPWHHSGTPDVSLCREGTSRSLCSGQGTCTCGECRCNERANLMEHIRGQFCECTNFLCDRHNGLLCSDNGECVCNECRCKPGWRGDACNCEDSVDNCVNPDNGLICSNQGSCECNQCKCYQTEDWGYAGKWCEECPTCESKCLVYKPCVQCQVFNTSQFTEEQCDHECTLFNASRVAVAEVEKEGERVCTFHDENDCQFTFVYGYDNRRSHRHKEVYVRVKKTLECPSENDFFGTVWSVLGSMWQFVQASRVAAFF